MSWKECSVADGRRKGILSFKCSHACLQLWSWCSKEEMMDSPGPLPADHLVWVSDPSSGCQTMVKPRQL